jgi:G3E family GTPase
MLEPMHPVPTLIVTGVDRRAKAAFLRALLAARPPKARWALLDNDGGELAQQSPAAVASARTGGCACCSGQVALQTGIVRLLRESRPQRLVIVAAAAAEPPALARALQQQPLAQALRIEGRLCIVAADAFAAADSAARALWQRQMAAADQVLAADAPISAGLAGTAPASSDSSRLIAS